MNESDPVTTALRNKGWVEVSPGTWAKPNHFEDSRKPPVAERSSWKTFEAQDGIEKARSGKVRVRITDVRRRLIDVDNLVSKFHVDCCRYAGLLHSDAPDKTTIEVTQRKHCPGELPHTEIVIEQL